MRRPSRDVAVGAGVVVLFVAVAVAVAVAVGAGAAGPDPGGRGAAHPAAGAPNATATATASAAVPRLRLTAASPTPDLRIDIVGDDGGTSALTTGVIVALIAAAVSVLTTLLAQVLVRKYETRRRRASRQTTRLEGLVSAVHELEAAYAKDSLTEVPDDATIAQLLRAQRMFTAAVALVSDETVKKLALAWQSLAQQEALVRDPDARAVTQQQLQSAVNNLMEGIRQVEDSLE